MELMYKYLVFAVFVGGISGQSIADLLQRQNNNLLQQTMMRNLQNQVNFFGSSPSSSRTRPTSLVDQLSSNVNRMTQSLMNSMTSSRMPGFGNTGSIFSEPSASDSNLIPVNVLLNQQRNLQNSLNGPQNPSQQSQTIFVVPAQQGGRQWGGQTMDPNPVPTRSQPQPNPRDLVNIVILERNDTTGNNQPTVSRTQTTRMLSPQSPATNSSFNAMLSRLGFSFPNSLPTSLTGTTNPMGSPGFGANPNTAGEHTVGDFIILDGNPSHDPTIIDQTGPIGTNNVVFPGARPTSNVGSTTGQRPTFVVNPSASQEPTFGSGRPTGQNRFGSGPSPRLPFGGGFPTRSREVKPRSQTGPSRTNRNQPSQTKTPRAQTGPSRINRNQPSQTKTPRAQTGPSRTNRNQPSQTKTTRTKTGPSRTTSRQNKTPVIQAKTKQVQQKQPSVVQLPRQPIQPKNPSISQRSQPSSSASGSTLLHSQETLSCTARFQAIPGHTLCMTDKAGVTRTGVAPNDKMFITQFHNDLRSRVQPPAADLLNLQWDERLASVAQKWSKQCVLAHDDERKLPELGMSVGQNVAVGFETWQEAIQMWYDEINMYRYGEEPDSYLGADGWKEIAHFTQMVQNGTYLIGCGYSECPATSYKRFYVCNYAAGQTDLAYPYTAGARCGSCPNSCKNGLCDCGGLVCQNKGRLDPSTCKCDCPKPYTGARCDQVDCPAQDNWICGRDWPPSYCDKFYNVPEECPHMCGICSSGAGKGGAIDGGLGNNNGGTVPATNISTFTSSFGCRYTGVRDDQATCRAYGDKGNDMKMCSSQGGTVGCEDCERYFNIKKDYCPVMCGLCEPPCGGKRCSNGGTLDTNTCACSCRKPFTGDTCEFAQCPVDGDPGFCRFWPKNYCQMYYNVPEECPYMCGICKQSASTAKTRPTEANVQSPTTEANEAP